MNKQKWIVGSVGLLALIATSSAWAVKTDVDGYYYELAPGAAEKNLEAVRALIKTADAHGFVRNNGTGTNCFSCTLPSFELKGSGTYGGVENADVVIDFDYRQPAIRVDVTTKANKARTVTVAAKGITWDESAPGIFSKASTVPALDRLVSAYILPSQVIYAAGLATDKITLATQGANKVMTVPVPEYSTTIKATIDAKGFITGTEMAYGGKTYTGEYSDIDTDHMDNHVFLPHRIVQKVDGKVVTDLKLVYHWSVPYLLFRTPDEIAKK